MQALMSPASAETLALKALGWLVNLPDALDRFMSGTGAGHGDLRAGMADPQFLCSVVDFLLGNEALLTGFCEDEGIKPQFVHQARHALLEA